ncbi:EutN/CcmL family microcompartment protein [candidate division CSSED10-310 bacterium]|uniref:EutN/CcmL family microcompartment protein n=1 Tax=candidate division CSSED10-310 bacterium TaxID=2855610 RepID=A0ABV6Z438_UNCC1
MKFAIIIGNCVATRKDEKITGRKLMVIQPVDISFQKSGDPLVAVDAVGAGEGELILFASGSSARQTTLTEGTPCDCVIMAIVDTVDFKGSIVFDKSKEK